MSIECWVTAPDGTYLAHLDRSEASPFRHFAVSRTIGAEPGVGSLEYHLSNALIHDNPDLLDDDNLVWMRYRGKTLTWVIEERAIVLDEAEHATDWARVTGRGVKQLLADRIVWPMRFDMAHTDPAQWDAGAWKTTLDGNAASGQKVIPVTSTVGAVVGDPVELISSTDTEVGVIASVAAGVSVTLVDDLDSTFHAGDRIASAARQWRRFVNRPAGEMLWDLISESNPRFATQITRGTVETDPAEGVTVDLRFDNLLDVVDDTVTLFGDIDMDGLEFSYFNDPGVDRSNQVIFEEGADVLKVERRASVRDKLTWVVAEGLGEGVTAKLRIATIAADRRREAYVEAKDAGNVKLLQQRANAARREHPGVDSIAVTVTEDRFAVFEDYDVNDTVRVLADSRAVNESLRVVAIYLAETDDERVEVSIDVNTRRQDRLLSLDAAQKDTRHSLGVRDRMPQGQLVPFSFSGADIFDSTDTMDVFLFVPDRMYIAVEARALVRFREFFTGAKSLASSGTLTSTSGGGATSGSSSTSSSTSDLTGLTFVVGSSNHSHGGGAAANATFSGNAVESVSGTGSHNHGISHTHSTPNHQHDVPGHTHTLGYGVFKETYPGSHSVTLKVYELVAGTWTLAGTIPGLTSDIEDVDLTAFITGPGKWRIELKSDAAQPNGGRLGCDVSGYVLGAIQSA